MFALFSLKIKCPSSSSYQDKLRHAALTFFALLACVASSLLQANEHQVGDITIHYNALSTANISADVATQYKITRSNRTGLVNISVHKQGKAVIANIFGHGKNLTGQLKELAFKEIIEGDAIYYIATFSFNEAEKVSFDLQIQAEKKGKLLPLLFKQKMFGK